MSRIQHTLLFTAAGALIALALLSCGAQAGIGPTAGEVRQPEDSPTVPSFPTTRVAATATLPPPSPTPAPTGTPTITPTPEPLSWTGPLLYPDWGLYTLPDAIPVFDLGSGQAGEIPTADTVNYVRAWSPDGCYVAYNSGNGALRVINVVTLQDRFLAVSELGQVAVVRWSPNGEWIAFKPRMYDSEIYLARSDGSDLRQRRINRNRYWSGQGRTTPCRL